MTPLSIACLRCDVAPNEPCRVAMFRAPYCLARLQRAQTANHDSGDEDRCYEVMNRSPSSFNEWCNDMDEWLLELRSR